MVGTHIHTYLFIVKLCILFVSLQNKVFILNTGLSLTFLKTKCSPFHNSLHRYIYSVHFTEKWIHFVWNGLNQEVGVKHPYTDWIYWLYLIKKFLYVWVFIYKIIYSWFHIKGTWSVHTFNGDHISIPSAHR